MDSNAKKIIKLIQHKAVEEQENHNKISLALTRIKNSKTENIRLKPLGKVSVQQLADEAKVSRASLYGNHKDFLEELSKINSKRTLSVTANRKSTQTKIDSDKKLIQDLIRQKELLAQENYRINEENKDLKRRNNALISQLGTKSNVTSIR